MRGNENANINFAVVVTGDPDSIVIFKKANKKWETLIMGY